MKAQLELSAITQFIGKATTAGKTAEFLESQLEATCIGERKGDNLLDDRQLQVVGKREEVYLVAGHRHRMARIGGHPGFRVAYIIL